MTQIRVGLQQRVIPAYRVPFLNDLADHLEIDLHVFSGLPKKHEMIKIASDQSRFDHTLTDNLQIFDKRLFLSFQPGLTRWLHTLQPEVVILEANPRYLSSWQALNWLHNRQIANLGWGLGVPQRAGKMLPVQKIIRSKFLLKFNGMIAYSATGKQQYIQMGFPPEKVFVAPNATAPRPAGSVPLRSVTNDSGKLIVLFVGRLQERKKIDLLIHACAQIPETLQPELWIVGEGSIMPDLIQLASSTYPRTRFFGGVYGEELETLFQKANLFVLPGTGGLAIQQAMAAGLPVIVAEGDGSQSNLVTAETGWLVPPGNEAALQSAMQAALENPNLLQKMGLAAFEKVRTDVNIQTMVSVFVQAIKSVRNKENHHGE